MYLFSSAHIMITEFSLKLMIISGFTTDSGNLFSILHCVGHIDILKKLSGFKTKDPGRARRSICYT